jgi:cell division protein FtsL
MTKKKLFISIAIFSFLMILTSIIKTQTRIMEKNISSYEKKISNLRNSLYESQLDFYYLSSPSSISEKINNYSNDDYETIEYSNIYFSLDQFLKKK